MGEGEEVGDEGWGGGGGGEVGVDEGGVVCDFGGAVGAEGG